MNGQEFIKYQFSGHESFTCKHYWLKKGYDFVAAGKSFGDESAVIDLGVGKNMVTSIAYWLKAFGLVDQANKPTEFANQILSDENGHDPYIESLTTIWALQFWLIITGKASLYSLFFNQFRKTKTDFTKDQLFNYVKRTAEEDGQKSFTENTLTADIAVFIRNYLNPSDKDGKTDVEEDFSGLLTDLALMRCYKSEDMDGKKIERYEITSKVQVDLPAGLVLYAILANEKYGSSIPFKELLTGHNSPGVIFALNEEGLYSKIEQLVSKHKNITYTETAGVREFQIKSKMSKDVILNGCY